MHRAAILFAFLSVAPLPAAANEFQPVYDRGQFLTLVEGRELRLGLFGVKLRVAGDGTLQGEAVGDPVVGQWSWRDGYFCREMDWSGMPIPYNCQLVEAAGGTKVRFTVDRGEGRSAEFTLR